MVLVGLIKEMASRGGRDDSEAKGLFHCGHKPRPADRLRRRRPVRRKPGTDGIAVYECGMRRTSPSNWNATQYAIIAHFGISSQTRSTARLRVDSSC